MGHNCNEPLATFAEDGIWCLQGVKASLTDPQYKVVEAGDEVPPRVTLVFNVARCEAASHSQQQALAWTWKTFLRLRPLKGRNPDLEKVEILNSEAATEEAVAVTAAESAASSSSSPDPRCFGLRIANFAEVKPRAPNGFDSGLPPFSSKATQRRPMRASRLPQTWRRAQGQGAGEEGWPKKAQGWAWTTGSSRAPRTVDVEVPTVGGLGWLVVVIEEGLTG
ncbi:LOW QUALITY PROTEIN: hypothetical protein RJ640_001969 [Escallonia rubra]|uniref:Uncharacterized protein n=1 Tax=Escallonia rubra TaxID=112253 RepID=A0AA88UMS0_9ASTE|nr:LOW QUALITY PROTEIN: hypothetical protein RJ640_001969 [Escallonia rubra]